LINGQPVGALNFDPTTATTFGTKATSSVVIGNIASPSTYTTIYGTPLIGYQSGVTTTIGALSNPTPNTINLYGNVFINGVAYNTGGGLTDTTLSTNLGTSGPLATGTNITLGNLTKTITTLQGSSVAIQSTGTGAISIANNSGYTGVVNIGVNSSSPLNIGNGSTTINVGSGNAGTTGVVNIGATTGAVASAVNIGTTSTTQNIISVGTYGVSAVGILGSLLTFGGGNANPTTMDGLVVGIGNLGVSRQVIIGNNVAGAAVSMYGSILILNSTYGGRVATGGTIYIGNTTGTTNLIGPVNINGTLTINGSAYSSGGSTN